ncbi:hypothetical protein [Caldibacillus sp. 210928-DFI.2.22]|uniref:hypothetical protein n=1 Tax=Caldibacillus sp. 210928-DFI.2.22 TaxID=2883265 RepID=UPI001D08A1D6|nr:hypothetical protein [Caldibacillus sp. 210928-DFI.2.22]
MVTRTGLVAKIEHFSPQNGDENEFPDLLVFHGTIPKCPFYFLGVSYYVIITFQIFFKFI